MTNESDPVLQTLFDQAKSGLDDEAFVTSVMAKVESERRRSITTWIAVAAVFVAVAWFFVPGIVNTVDLMSQMLPQSLVELDMAGALFEPIVSPLNSVSTVVALALLGAWLLYRKVF